MKLYRPTNVCGSPESERISSFANYFYSKGKSIEFRERPLGIKRSIREFVHLLFAEDREVFISMPPFCGWWIYLVPNLKVYTDFRDGWSIAMSRGYGGTSQPNALKAKVARLIEKLAISRSHLTITCTPGLLKYHQATCKSKIVLIPNGISRSDYEMCRKIIASKYNLNRHALVVSCAGKFSEYGRHNVRQALRSLERRYLGNNIKLRLFGSNKNDNLWLLDEVKKYEGVKISVEIFERLPRNLLFKEISQSDLAIALVRDPTYEFGTKIFEYIALNIPILDYFESRNSFTEYFQSALDSNNEFDAKLPTIVRELLIEGVLNSELEMNRC